MSLKVFFGGSMPMDDYAEGERYALAFDGLGGDGGGLCVIESGESWPEGKIAAVAAAQATKTAMEERLDDWTAQMDFTSPETVKESAGKIAAELSTRLKEAIEKRAEELDGRPQKLPTTVAGWIAFPMPDGRTLGLSLWAGDSRCYAMDARGMRLFSTDGKNDVMLDCLSGHDLPMSYCLKLNDPFELRWTCHVFEAPTLLMACSDGFYKGIPSPMHFEHTVRSIMGKARAGASADARHVDQMAIMARAWQQYSVSHNLPQDDAETLVTIFVNDDPQDGEALQRMMVAPLERLNAQYIQVYPHGPRNLDNLINRFASILWQNDAKYQFHAALKQNALRWAMSSEPLPRDLPCRSAIREMREQAGEAQDRLVSRRRPLQNQLAEAERRLKEKVDELGWTQMAVEPVTATPSDETTGRLNAAYGDDAIDNCVGIAESLSRIIPGRMKSIKANGHSRQKDKEQLGHVWQAIVDLCACVEYLTDKAGLPGVSLISTSKTELKSRRVRLSDAERKALFDALIGNGTAGIDGITLPAKEAAELAGIAAEYLSAKAALEDFTDNVDGADGISLKPLEDYLKEYPDYDARYLMKTWLKTGAAPKEFRLPEGLETLFQNNVEFLQDVQRQNERIKSSAEEIRAQKLALWEKYRVDFEAWDTPLTFERENRAEEGTTKEPDKPQETPEESQRDESPAAAEPQAGKTPEHPKGENDDEYPQIDNE